MEETDNIGPCRPLAGMEWSGHRHGSGAGRGGKTTCSAGCNQRGRVFGPVRQACRPVVELLLPEEARALARAKLSSVGPGERSDSATSLSPWWCRGMLFGVFHAGRAPGVSPWRIGGRSRSIRRDRLWQGRDEAPALISAGSDRAARAERAAGVGSIDAQHRFSAAGAVDSAAGS